MSVKDRLWQECFLFIVKENSSAFYRYAYSVLLSRQDAEDAVSEMILKAFEHLGDLQNIHKMKSWMFQILANTCKTMLSNRRYISAETDQNAPGPQNLEEYMDLRECICQMEMKFREVVVLYYFNDLKTSEIAKILGVSEGTVKSRLSRARDKIKKHLEAESK